MTPDDKRDLIMPSLDRRTKRRSLSFYCSCCAKSEKKKKKEEKRRIRYLSSTWKEDERNNTSRIIIVCQAILAWIRGVYMYARAHEWMNEWIVQFINREYVLCTKSVYMYTMHKAAMMCIVLGMCICTHYSAIEYRWWCEVKRKKGRETQRKREECIVSAAVKNNSCASSPYCALDTLFEQ